jgi:TRAP-type mannitol/chloroaromatic compound transport system permease large subunit
MEIWVLFGVFTLLLIIGTPVAFCLGIASLATVLYMQLPPVVVFQQINSGMNAFAMMAIPFFIYAGDLMMRGGIADRLIRLAAGFVGSDALEHFLQAGIAKPQRDRLLALIFTVPRLFVLRELGDAF